MKYQKSYSVFLIGLTLYVFACVCIESSLGKYGLLLRSIKYLGIAFIIMSALKNSKYTIHNGPFVFICLVFILAFINYFFCGGGTIILELILIVCSFLMSQCEIRKLYKVQIGALVTGHLFVIALSCFGVIEDNVTTRTIDSSAGVFFAREYTRHQFGFLSSNQVPLTLMVVYLLIIACFESKVPLVLHTIVQIANLYCFFLFGARVAFILNIITVVLFYLVRFKKRSLKNKAGLLWLFFPICAMISFIASFLYDSNSSFWNTINYIFYNRLKWASIALDKYGLTIWGNGLSAGAATGAYGEELVDNGYVLVYIRLGLILSFVIIGLWSLLMYYAEKRKDYFLAIVLIVISIASVIDNHLTSYKMIPIFCELMLISNSSCYDSFYTKKNGGIKEWKILKSEL